MGYKTIKLDEFADRVYTYWHPSDLDIAQVQQEVDDIKAGWANQTTFLRLVFDDETQVLTEIDHVLPGGNTDIGNYQWVWQTGEQPTEVVARARRAEAVASFPASFDDMWQTYNSWDDYLQYAAERYMSENAEFVAAVDQYRNAPSVGLQQQIVGEYILNGAPKEINIDDSMRSDLAGLADGAGNSFDEAQGHIFEMLRADFRNFLTWLEQRV